MSKYAAARGNKELLLELLIFLETGQWQNIPPRKLQYFKRYGYVVPSRSGYVLTPKGTKTLSEEKVWALTIPTQKTWDGKWYFVLFDIPVDKRKRRDSFRRRLQELGLTLYQNSVWVYPHPIEETVSKIAAFYGLEKYVSFIAAETISNEKVLRTYFRI